VGVAADLLARTGRERYRALVYDDPELLEYFRLATPIDVIERLRIGSRPPSRRGGSGIDNLRAIPWVFAWTQNRHLLTGWYGVGLGLEAIVAQHGLATARTMLAGWRYFANVIADVEMVMAKADMQIGARYAELAGDLGARVYAKLAEEFERTRRLICDITSSRELLERDPRLATNIRLRNPYVDPMSLVQVDLLRRWRAGERTDPELERVLVLTVKGIARGLQNTG
jgi:phosphoenolpyruvate carboxylase